jgi:ornithine carbamoyltransferase
MKDLLKTSDLTRGDLKYLLGRAQKFKARPHQRRSVLAGESVCLYFAKPSTRTRISFDVAVTRLGGSAVVLGANDVQLGRGETIEDTARVISRFARAFVIRTFKDEDVERFAAAASIPVVNALTDGHHPCQSLADLLTLHEHKGALDKLKVTYLGDGNNVAVSLMQACALIGAEFALGAPKGYQISEALVEEARSLAKKGDAKITVTEDPAEALRGADAVYADVWLSMGDSDSEKAARHAALGPYTVDQRAMSLAKPDAIFMHCLPAHRGEEVTAEVCDGPQSVIFDQAENRLHTSVAVLYALLEGKLEGRASAG